MKKVVVIGAGIVGVCCALELQKRGCKVTLIDSDPPVQGVSYGNAGVFNNSAVSPYQSRSIVKLLPSFMLNLDPRFRFHWPHVFLLMPWLLKSLSHCNARSFENGLNTLSYILKDAVDLHTTLLRESDAMHLFQDSGWLRLHPDEADYKKTEADRRDYDRCGVKYEILNSGEIQELEPDISRKYEKAIWLTHTPCVTSPEKLGMVYFEKFRSLGGKFQQLKAKQISRINSGLQVKTDSHTLECEHLVVAMGAKSSHMLRPLGIKIPLAMERGYHLSYQPAEGKKLNRSIIDAHLGLVMTPMDMGIRVTSGVNLVARETRPTYSQILNLEPEMKAIFPLGKRLIEHPWMGHRPSTPDSLPVIGRAVEFNNLWLAFGHGHLGLTLAPKTGELIANAIHGIPNDAEADAFLPNRF